MKKKIKEFVKNNCGIYKFIKARRDKKEEEDKDG